MADDARTPVAIRITRPYGSEDEFLRHELDSLTRTTVTLLGAQSRPQGVVLRFEVTLSSGDPLLRGEGRVVGFRPAAQGNDSGLTLRFTRLDARSKALVDKAAGLREARARASMHPPRLVSEPSASPSPPSVRPLPPPLPTPSVSVVGSGPLSLALLEDSSPALSSARALEARAPEPRASEPRPSAPSLRSSAGPLPSQSAARRDELLDRLRQRAKTLSPSAVESLLASRAKRA